MLERLPSGSGARAEYLKPEGLRAEPNPNPHPNPNPNPNPNPTPNPNPNPNPDPDQVRRHKASKHDLVANYLCLSALKGDVGMSHDAAEKFTLSLPSWADRLQNDMAAAD